MKDDIKFGMATGTGNPHVTTEQAKEIVSKKIYSRVTEESIKDKIEAVTYYGHYTPSGGWLTICVIDMTNGFAVHGVSAAADPRNHDAEVGKRYAFDNAFKQLWQLEGYLLREKLHQYDLSYEALKASDPF